MFFWLTGQGVPSQSHFFPLSLIFIKPFRHTFSNTGTSQDPWGQTYWPWMSRFPKKPFFSEPLSTLVPSGTDHIAIKLEIGCQFSLGYSWPHCTGWSNHISPKSLVPLICFRFSRRTLMGFSSLFPEARKSNPDTSLISLMIIVSRG